MEEVYSSTGKDKSTTIYMKVLFPRESLRPFRKSFYFGLFALVAGLVVLVGWMFDISSLKSAFGVALMMVCMSCL